MNLPAVCGIKNHGNTCFINSVIQCLSNIDVFAEYFVTDNYKVDRKKHTKIHNKSGVSSHSSTRGEVSDSLSCLLKSLWTGRYSSDISMKFKSVVAKHGPQYEGWDQHDAQEFLLWLLDRTHEELNIALKGKTASFNSFGKSSLPRAIKSGLASGNSIGHSDHHPQSQPRPDEEVAAETLDNHLKHHLSFVHDLFQAQLKSCLTCRSCGKTSNTFDPFLCLSVPVPSTPMHSLLITVSFLDRSPKQLKLSLPMESQSSLRDVRDKISRQIRVPEKNLVLLRLDHGNGLRELIRDTTPLSDLLHDLKEILVVETPKVPETNGGVSPTINGHHSHHSIPSSPTMSSCLTLVLVNQEGSSPGQLFGPLFSCCISRDSSYFRIQMEILKTIRPIVRPSFRRSGLLQFQEDDKLIDFSDDEDSFRRSERPTSPLTRMFRLRVVSGSSSTTSSSPSSRHSIYLPHDVEHPLFMPIVDEATAFCEDTSYKGPLHLMIVIEWNLEARSHLLLDLEEMPSPTEDPSVSLSNQHPFHVNLLDCLDLYFREEKLAAENAWMCPNCKKYQASFKKLSLWSLPDVFILHLKRFKQTSSNYRSKLSTAVDFPINGLDMTPYLEKRKRLRTDDEYFNQNNRLYDRPPSHSSFRKKQNGLSNNSNFFSNDQHNNHYHQNNKETLSSQWSRSGKRWSDKDDVSSGVYDLIAVCNHSGGLQSGHYTSVCRNPVDKHWYSYDDTKVHPTREAHVVSANAYILFYQRRMTASSPSSCTSSSGYSSNGISDPLTDSGLHWIHRMNHKEYKPFGSLTPVLSEFDSRVFDYYFANLIVATGRRFQDLNHERGTFSYATLPSSKTARTLIRLFRGRSRDRESRDRNKKEDKYHPRASSASNITRSRGREVVILPEEIIPPSTPLESCSSRMRVILPEEKKDSRPSPPSPLNLMTNERSATPSSFRDSSSPSSSGDKNRPGSRSSKSPTPSSSDGRSIQESRSCWTVTSV